MYYTTTFKLTWNKTYVEFITGKKFITEEEFQNYISDESVEIIKKAIEDKSIYWLFEIKKNETV